MFLVLGGKVAVHDAGRGVEPRSRAIGKSKGAREGACRQGGQKEGEG